MAASFECDHGAERRRHHGKPCEEHPFRAHVCAAERFCERNTLSQFVASGRTRFRVLFLQALDKTLDVYLFQYIEECFRTYRGAEHGSVFNGEEVIRRFVQDDAFADGFNFLFRFLRFFLKLRLHFSLCGGFRLRLEFLFQFFEKPHSLRFIDGGDNVAREVDDFLDFRCGKSEKKRYAGRNAAEEPNVCDRGCEIYVSHALAADDGARYLHAALLTDDTAEADAAGFAAVTFVIFFRTEHALVEKTVLFRTLSTIVDGLRLRYLAPAPLHHSVWACEPHRDSFEILRYDVFLFHTRGVLEPSLSINSMSIPRPRRRRDRKSTRLNSSHM